MLHRLIVHFVSTSLSLVIAFAPVAAQQSGDGATGPTNVVANLSEETRALVDPAYLVCAEAMSVDCVTELIISDTRLDETDVSSFRLEMQQSLGVRAFMLAGDLDAALALLEALDVRGAEQAQDPLVALLAMSGSGPVWNWSSQWPLPCRVVDDLETRSRQSLAVAEEVSRHQLDHHLAYYRLRCGDTVMARRLLGDDWNDDIVADLVLHLILEGPIRPTWFNADLIDAFGDPSLQHPLGLSLALIQYVSAQESSAGNPAWGRLGDPYRFPITRSLDDVHADLLALADLPPQAWGPTNFQEVLWPAFIRALYELGETTSAQRLAQRWTPLLAGRLRDDAWEATLLYLQELNDLDLFVAYFASESSRSPIGAIAPVIQSPEGIQLDEMCEANDFRACIAQLIVEELRGKRLVDRVEPAITSLGYLGYFEYALRLMDPHHEDAAVTLVFQLPQIADASHSSAETERLYELLHEWLLLAQESAGLFHPEMQERLWHVWRLKVLFRYASEDLDSALAYAERAAVPPAEAFGAIGIARWLQHDPGGAQLMLDRLLSGEAGQWIGQPSPHQPDGLGLALALAIGDLNEVLPALASSHPDACAEIFLESVLEPWHFDIPSLERLFLDDAPAMQRLVLSLGVLRRHACTDAVPRRLETVRDILAAREMSELYGLRD